MARQFLTQLDMQNNQVLNLVIQNLSAPPVAGSLSVVQHYGASASSGPSGVASTCLTSNCVIGNAVVLEIFVGGAGTVVSISSPIGTFVKCAGAATSNGDTEQWWCKSAVAAASTVTVTTTSGSYSAIGIEVAGGAVSMTATSYNLGSGSPSMSIAGASGDVAIALAGADSAGFTTAPTSPWTNLNGSGLWAVSDALDYAWQVLATTGTVTAAWAQSSSAWQGVIVDLAAPRPTAGLVYYDTTLNQFGFYNGTSWVYGGSPGPAGGDSFAFTFSTGLGSSPASGTVNLDGVSPAVGNIYVSNTDAAGTNIASWLGIFSIGDAVKIFNQSNPEQFMWCFIVEPVAPVTGGVAIGVNVIASNGTFDTLAGDLVLTHAVTGPQGSTGATGLVGGDTARYTFSTATTSTPATGIANFNSTSFGSVTSVYVNGGNYYGQSMLGWLESLPTGRLKVFNASIPSAAYVILNVTGYSLSGSVITLAVTYVASSGSTFGTTSGDLALTYAPSGTAFPALSSAPSAPTLGQSYFDSTLKMAAYWSGSAWFYIQSPETLVLAKMAFR